MKMRQLFLGLLVALTLTSAAKAELVIQITGGNANAIPIAIAPFEWAGGGTPPSADFQQIISSNLQRTGEFRPFSTLDQPVPPGYSGSIDYAPWRSRGIQYLVLGRITASGSRYAIEFALYDVMGGRQMMSDRVTVGSKDERFGAHTVSDLVYEELTGVRGAFATRIAFVTTNQRANTLQISDSDGFNARAILATNDPILSPAWSPDGKQLAYVSFEGNKPSIYVQDVTSGKRTKVTSFPGINGAPAWSPDGSRLAVSLSKDGNPEIYTVNVNGGGLQRLTDSPGIDTEPDWSPDGQSIIFTSDRTGNPQVYQMPASGGTASRLTFEGKYNSNASFAPDGRNIVLVTRGSSGYQIGLFDSRTRGMQLVSRGSLDESPSFAPNGKMIIYAAGSSGTLTVVPTDYDVETRLAAQSGQVRDPAWSPFLIPRGQR